MSKLIPRVSTSCISHMRHRRLPTRVYSEPEDHTPPSWIDGVPIGYWSKQRERKTDSLGRIDYDGDNVAESALFSKSAQLDLALTVAARDAGLDVEELSARLASLYTLLPGITKTV